MILEEQSVEEFAREFHDKYEEESILEEITDRVHWKEKFDELEYTKIGRRVGLPVDIINSDADPIAVISSFCRSLRVGERNYVASELNKEADSGTIETFPIGDINDSVFSSLKQSISNPNHLILPLDSDYHSEFHQKKIRSKHGIDVTWIPLKHEIKNGFLYDSSRVTIIQKWFNEMDDPPFDHVTKFNKYSQNRPLTLYFGKDTFTDKSQESKYQKQIDFLFSTSLSEVLIEENAAIRLEPEKELTEE